MLTMRILEVIFYCMIYLLMLSTLVGLTNTYALSQDGDLIWRRGIEFQLGTVGVLWTIIATVGSRSLFDYNRGLGWVSLDD